MKKAVNGMLIREGFAIGEQKENVKKEDEEFCVCYSNTRKYIYVVQGIIVNYI